LRLFSKHRDKRRSPGWYPTDQAEIVAYFDGQTWRGRALLSGLDNEGPVPMGAEAQAEEALASLRDAIDVASQARMEAIADLESFRTESNTTRAHITAEIERLQAGHHAAQEALYLAEVGFRDYPTAADGSEAIAGRLRELRDRQREMVKSGAALSIHGDLERHFSKLEIINPLRKKHLYDTFSTIFLRTFNVECEMAIRQLRRNSSYESSSNRVLKACKDVHAAGLQIGLSISNEYVALRHEECTLVFQHLTAKAIERIQREAERDRQRDEQRAQEEYSFALIQFDKELEHYRIMLARMRGLGDAEAVARYEDLIAGIEEQAAEIRLRAQNIRAGYVYIISNIGSFGEGIVKIGLTRRLEPMNRVKELSNASVPFRYDVHALYFSQDAVSLETSLHHHFEERRVNKINRRREFFRATPNEVLEVLRSHDVDVDLVEWIEDPDATEYRLTKGQEALSMSTSFRTTEMA
jgi:hypothetical protein